MLKRLTVLGIALLLLCCAACAEGAAVPADGLYTVGVTSSSDMFRVTQCVLRVEGGKITAVLTLSGHGYGYLYVGTGAEADQAPQSDWAPFVEDQTGAYTYAIEIPALDEDLSVAAYSIRYSKWYDRTLNFLSGSLRDYDMVPADGSYAVDASLDGATLPCSLSVKDGAMTASLALSGDDALRADGTDHEAADGTVSFPVSSLDKNLAVETRGADGSWTAHSLRLLSQSLKSLALVPDDGTYSISVQSDSNLFPVSGCTLSVTDGKMTAYVTVENGKYDSVYAGSAKDARQADAEAIIPAVVGMDGSYTYALPLTSLDGAVPVSTWSEKKSKWYDRTLTFDAASLAPLSVESALSFAFTGGTGRVTITCPTLSAVGNEAIATIVFSSTNYTYAQTGGVKYYNQNVGGNSTFLIPVTVNGATTIEAETTAMGDSHVVEYVIYVYTDGTDAAAMAGTPEATTAPAPTEGARAGEAPVVSGLAYVSTLPLACAQCFAVYFYEDGYCVVSVSDGRNYLVVPEGKTAPEGADADFVILKQPIDRAYLAATSAMCLFDAMDGLPVIRFSGTRAENWYVENAAAAMDAGDILYAGKYSAPDYELLLSGGCDLAIESTMITYAPEAMEKLEELGVPVWIDLSSYEPEPLGRTEWIKAYGVLLGRTDAAEAVFDAQKAYVDALSGIENTGLSVAYFYINASGLIVTKPATDSFARMIGLAGGNYVPAGLEGADGDSSVTMDAESFYAATKDADFLIYNAAIDQAPGSVSDLAAANAMFADFKAVREGNVWCTEKSLYQSSDKIGLIVSDLNAILTGNTDGVDFLRHLE